MLPAGAVKVHAVRYDIYAQTPMGLLEPPW